MSSPTALEHTLAVPSVGAPERQVCDYLLVQHHRERKITKQCEDSNDATKCAILSSGFAIFVAYLIQRFFFDVVGNVVFSFNPPFNDTETYTLWTVWFAIVWVVYPSTWVCMKGYSASGSRPRTLWEDIADLWKATVKVMLVWAFKDWVFSFEHIMRNAWVDGDDGYPSDAASVWFNHYTARSWDVLGWYILTEVVVLCIVVFFTTAVLVMLHLYQTKCKRTGMGLTNNILDAPPFLLGIGLLQSNLFTLPWYFFPYKWYNPGTNEAIYTAFIRTVTMMICGYVCIPVKVWHTNYKKTIPAETSVVAFAKNTTIALLVNSLPFSFSYQLSQWTFEIYFRALFDCSFPFTSCGSYTLWMWIGFTFGYVTFTLLMVPSTKEGSHRMERLSKVYSESLMKLDAGTFENQLAFINLYTTASTISIGRAFMGLAAADCAGNSTPTCPSNYSVENVILYAVSIGLFILLISWAYHVYIKGFRFDTRANLVAAVEAGQSHELFKVS